MLEVCGYHLTQVAPNNGHNKRMGNVGVLSTLSRETVAVFFSFTFDAETVCCKLEVDCFSYGCWSVSKYCFNDNEGARDRC